MFPPAATPTRGSRDAPILTEIRSRHRTSNAGTPPAGAILSVPAWQLLPRWPILKAGKLVLRHWIQPADAKQASSSMLSDELWAYPIRVSRGPGAMLY
jgi:hypothetical protein